MKEVLQLLVYERPVEMTRSVVVGLEAVEEELLDEEALLLEDDVLEDELDVLEDELLLDTLLNCVEIKLLLLLLLLLEEETPPMELRLEELLLLVLLLLLLLLLVVLAALLLELELLLETAGSTELVRTSSSSLKTHKSPLRT
jgi:hypothetical protein